MAFSMNVDGSACIIVHTFGEKKLDGRNPYGSLLLLNGTDLYGTTASGGAFGKGTVFRRTSEGANDQVLHWFSDKPDGEKPIDNVIEVNRTLNGMTTGGGADQHGAIFAVPITGD